MSYTIRRLTDPTDDKLQEIGAVFDIAFATEDAFKAVVGPDFNTLLPAVNRSQLMAGKLAGEIYIAEDAQQEVIGAIIWFGPGREIYDSDDQRKLALGPLMEKFPLDVREWYIGVIPKMEAFKKASLGDAARTQWYLQRVGVLPSWQGKGVGTALINEVRAKTGGLSIALQAVVPENVSVKTCQLIQYYEHLGFKVKGRIDVTALHGQFSVFSLLWEA